MIQKIVPKDKQHWLSLRAGVITSTEISALFNIPTYVTSYELWHRKKSSKVVEIDDNERMSWGRRLEDAIAQGITEDNSWIIRNMDEFIYDDQLKIGSSFDYCIVDYIKSTDENEDEIEIEKDVAILEIKNVDSLVYKEKWVDDMPPDHIQMQVQHQMLVSGIHKAYVGALVGGNTVKLIEFNYDDEVGKRIQWAAQKFWKTIKDNQPPPPDWLRDGNFILAQNPYSIEGKVIDVGSDSHIRNLVQRYKTLGAEIKEKTAMQAAIKAQLYYTAGDANKILGDGYTVSFSNTKPTSYVVNKKAGRTMRVNIKK